MILPSLPYKIHAYTSRKQKATYMSMIQQMAECPDDKPSTQSVTSTPKQYWTKSSTKCTTVY